MYCKYCGARLPEDAAYCPGCGVRLQTETAQQPLPAEAAAPQSGALQNEQTAAPQTPAVQPSEQPDGQPNAAAQPCGQGSGQPNGAVPGEAMPPAAEPQGGPAPMPGTPVQVVDRTGQPVAVCYAGGSGKRVNGLGLAGMIIGICGIFFGWVPVFGFLLSLTGLLLSAVGLAKRAEYRLNGFAVAGLVLNIVALIPAAQWMIAFFIALFSALAV